MRPTPKTNPKQPARKRAKKKKSAIPMPPASDWRTSDETEIKRRIQRARDEKHSVQNLDNLQPVFSTFAVKSPSGMTYQVEIRDINDGGYSCTCPDFRANGLGTCKHVESTLIHLKRRHKEEFRIAKESGSSRIDLTCDGDRLQIERNFAKLPRSLRLHFNSEGLLITDPDEALPKLRRNAKVRVSQDVEFFLESRRRAEERRRLRREYETGVVEGRHPEHLTLHPLYPFQREGMLHLAFGERAMVADEMGLGKTIQAIAACSLLQHLGKVKRVLVVTPASLKSEWEEQIRKFTLLSQRLVFGPRAARVRFYADPNPTFFTIVNYEQVVTDTLDINANLRPDVVILDEAQRIKNWATKTAQAVKRLESRYAFVLTGTPIENRIDELYSLVDFLDPTILGPLFRFNREFYHFDASGRPSDYKNLSKLRERIRPILLRRRKHHVETELPDRTDRTLLVKLTPAMRQEYDEVKKSVGELLQNSSYRRLTQKEQELLMILLGMMRMICDTPSIIKGRDCLDCPKLDEVAGLLDECLSDPDVKVIIFSEWEGMLKRVRDWADQNEIGYAWHTGNVPQKRRRSEINAFRSDPSCRLFLSTDSGGVGLNLQAASVVINCDLPWNPAKLEQRIARAWRKHQTRPVTVVNLVAEDTIEQAMLETLAHKMVLAEGVIDGTEEALAEAKLKRGADSVLARLKQILSIVPGNNSSPTAPSTPSDPIRTFAERAANSLGPALLHCQEALLPGEATPVLITVVRHRERAPALEAMYHEIDWKGCAPRLQVIDEGTWSAIEQLVASGMLTLNTRATRHLAGEASAEITPALTPEQLQRIHGLRELAEKKEKVAQVLIASDLADEAIPYQEAAEKARSEAEAIEKSGSS